jgi:hypothetical protein
MLTTGVALKRAMQCMAICILLLLEQSAALALEQRIALVIGNSAYADVALKNPANDARDMTKLLADLGFEVITRIDAGRREMFEAIREFRQRLRGNQALG